MKIKTIDYIYQAQDGARVRLFKREGGGWDYDAKTASGNYVWGAIGSAGDWVATKREAKECAAAVYGALKSVAVGNDWTV